MVESFCLTLTIEFFFLSNFNKEHCLGYAFEISS